MLQRVYAAVDNAIRDRRWSLAFAHAVAAGRYGQEHVEYLKGCINRAVKATRERNGGAK